MRRYSYDRRVANEQMVIRQVEFPSSDGSKTYKLYPGTAMTVVDVSPEGETFWSVSGWHAPQAVPADALEGKVLDLRRFFGDVARKARGVFLPPRAQKVFTLVFGGKSVRVEFGRGGPSAEVQHEDTDDEDYMVALSAGDFMSPDKFLQALS